MWRMTPAPVRSARTFVSPASTRQASWLRPVVSQLETRREWPSRRRERWSSMVKVSFALRQTPHQGRALGRTEADVHLAADRYLIPRELAGDRLDEGRLVEAELHRVGVFVGPGAARGD